MKRDAGRRTRTARARTGDPAPALAQLRNLGPASAAWLAATGVATPDDLRRLGAVEAFRRVAVHRTGDVSANLLYALAGAVDGRSWLAYTPDERAALRRAAGLAP